MGTGGAVCVCTGGSWSLMTGRGRVDARIDQLIYSPPDSTTSPFIHFINEGHVESPGAVAPHGVGGAARRMKEAEGCVP